MNKLFLLVFVMLATILSGCHTTLGQKFDLTTPTDVTFNGRRIDQPPAKVVRTLAPRSWGGERYSWETYRFSGRWDSNPKARKWGGL